MLVETLTLIKLYEKFLFYSFILFYFLFYYYFEKCIKQNFLTNIFLRNEIHCFQIC